MDWNIIIPAICSIGSAVLVAVLNNWDKINPNKKYQKETFKTVQKLQEVADNTHLEIRDISGQMQKLSSAQRTVLQTSILENCKFIQDAVKQDTASFEYEEKLKQLIILYREYYLCGFNSQARLYFNETIDIASKDDNAMVRNLMNQYFSEYNPNDNH